ncbi:MAG: tetratricopeptide repeat protein [Magnetococcus sp. YQC-5]
MRSPSPPHRKGRLLETRMLEATQSHQHGDLTAAEAGYRWVLSRDAKQADAWHLLGVLLHQKQAHAQAIHAIRQAIALRADTPFYHLNLGRACLALGQMEEAETAFRTVLTLEPLHVEALAGLTRLFLAQKQWDCAIQTCHTALQTAPADGIVLNLLGLALRHANRMEEAILRFREALQHNPSYAEASNNLGNTLRALGRLKEALPWLTRATEIQPERAELHANLGHLLLDLYQYDAAVTAYGRAANLAPEILEWSTSRITARILAGDATRALAESRAMLTLHRDPVLESQYLFLVTNVEHDPQRQARTHREWGTRLVTPTDKPLDHPPWPEPTQPIKVGYLSPDFCHHSVFTFFQAILNHHHPAICEVFLYANLPYGDEVTHRLRTLKGWRDIYTLNDAEVASWVRRDGIHILVDLAGHTTGNRLGLFALRPAPIQITFLGYPSTTGLPTMDYRMTDPVLDPPGTTEAYHTERLLRLPHAFFCYTPPATAPEVTPPPVLNRGYPTLGVFGRMIKFSPFIMDLWCAVLQRLPTARLLMQTPGLAEPSSRERVLAGFAKRGIPAHRLDLHDRMPLQEHLALHSHVDLILDSFPWNGHTATCHSLWMGVPTLTLTGQHAASRLGLSILTNLDMADWSATTPDDLIEKAITFLADPALLTNLRFTLRHRLLESVLCDGAGYLHDLEALYQHTIELAKIAQQ